MSEEAAVTVAPARRPSLTRREGAAHYLLEEFSTHELGEVRAAVWHRNHSAMFSLRISSGGAPSQSTLDRIAITGAAYQAVRRIDPHTHSILRAHYFGDGVRTEVLRPALRRFADFYDAMV